MGKLYNFKSLISKYSVPFELVQLTKGEWVSGKWEEGKSRTTSMYGAIVPMSEQKVYHSGGTYTVDDRELYVSEELGADLTTLQVVYKGNTYNVEKSRNFEEYADAYIYTLKWVGARK